MNRALALLALVLSQSSMISAANLRADPYKDQALMPSERQLQGADGSGKQTLSVPDKQVFDSPPPPQADDQGEGDKAALAYQHQDRAKQTFDSPPPPQADEEPSGQQAASTGFRPWFGIGGAAKQVFDSPPPDQPGAPDVGIAGIVRDTADGIASKQVFDSPPPPQADDQGEGDKRALAYQVQDSAKQTFDSPPPPQADEEPSGQQAASTSTGFRPWFGIGAADKQDLDKRMVEEPELPFPDKQTTSLAAPDEAAGKQVFDSPPPPQADDQGEGDKRALAYQVQDSAKQTFDSPPPPQADEEPSGQQAASTGFRPWFGVGNKDTTKAGVAVAESPFEDDVDPWRSTTLAGKEAGADGAGGKRALRGASSLRA